MSATSDPKTPLQSPPGNFIASASSGVLSIFIDPSPSSPTTGDTTSKSTRSSVDREYGGVTLPLGPQGNLTAYGKLREAAGTSTNAIQGRSTLEQLNNLGIEDHGDTADRDVSDMQPTESAQIGRPYAPKFSHIVTGQQSLNPFAEPFSGRVNPFGDYGNIGSPLRKGAGTSNPVLQDISSQSNSHSESGNVITSTSHNEQVSQTLPQAPKINPPLVPGAAPWNESVWDNYWLHKPETMYKREPDRNSITTVSPKAIIEDDSLHDRHNRPHTIQALSDYYRAISEWELENHGLNPQELTVQLNQERAMKEGFTGMTDLITKSALNRRTRQNWIERSGGLFHYARRMGNDPLIRAAKSEVINMATVIDKCRDGSDPWLKDIRPCRRGALRAQIYKAVFGGENGMFRQLNRHDAEYFLKVNASWITLAALRQELINIIEFMLEEMTDPETFTGKLSQSPPQIAKPRGEDVQPLRQAESPLQQPVARHVISPLDYRGTTRPLVQLDNLEAWHHPQVLSPTEVHGRRYQVSPAESHESAQYRQSASSGFSEQSPGIEMVSYQPPPVHTNPSMLPANVNRQPVVPGSMNHNGHIPMQQWSPQSFGPLPYGSGPQNGSSAPAFAYYVPYPMVPQMKADYEMSGQPQYNSAFFQATIPQQRCTASHGYASVAASGVNAGTRSVFVPGPSQRASTFPRQHQEAQRASATYLTGPNSRNIERSHRFGRQGSMQPSLPTLPYRPGSDDMFPQTVGGASVKLQELTRNGQPSLAMAMSRDITPFSETAKNTKPAGWGVVKIGNIPYSLTKQEVLGFLGRNAKIVTPDLGVPIHIIMDRSTGKTMDCYVEFFSNGDASAAVNKCNMRGHQLRLGDRAVDVMLSSQDELLKQLFPRAKNVVWEGGVPVIEESHEPFNTGFKSFVTGEEMVMIVRHAEQPHRSSYTQKCPQRAYECIISTLTKFPWFSVDNYTITTRDQLFAATRDQLNTLASTINRGGLPELTENLLNDLLMAGLNAYGFSDRQRWELCQVAGLVGSKVPMSPLAQWWPLEAVGRKAGVDEDVFEFYANLLFLHPATPPSDSLFSKYGLSQGTLGSKTMREVGAAEWELIDELLRGVLTS